MALEDLARLGDTILSFEGYVPSDLELLGNFDKAFGVFVRLPIIFEAEKPKTVLSVFQAGKDTYYLKPQGKVVYKGMKLIDQKLFDVEHKTEKVTVGGIEVPLAYTEIRHKSDPSIIFRFYRGVFDQAGSYLHN